MKHVYAKCACITLMLVAIVACDRPQSPAPGTSANPPGGAAAPDGTPAATPVELTDVFETTGDYVIGITYPQSATKYPKLATELKAYAESARAQLLAAAAERQQREPAGEGSEGATLYDLSLTFTEVLDSPELVAYAAEGSMYTGGAHGMPLLAHFVWLPQKDRRLTAEALVPQEDGWQDIAAHVREQLRTALSQRADGAALSPAQRSEMLGNASRMIDAGTEADVENFRQFEPVVDGAGHVTGLRFVFAPYQVGPYSDGTQAVEVPASVLLPHVAPEYRDLFDAGTTAAPLTAGQPGKTTS